jgi:hypothetical protein
VLSGTILPWLAFVYLYQKQKKLKMGDSDKEEALRMGNKNASGKQICL